MYSYTLRKADGTTETIGERNEEMDYKELQSLVGGRIEIIPRDYWKGTELDGENVVVFGYEEARLENQPRNPFFAVLHDEAGSPWDVVGDCVRQEEI